MAAWMKSAKTGRWFLTGEFTSHRIDSEAEARQISQVLGFASAEASPEAILAELARTESNRAALVKAVADAVLAGIATGAPNAGVDVAAIAAAVNDEAARRLAS